MTYPISVDKIVLERWANEKLEPDTVAGLLQEKGIDAESIKAHLKAYRQLRNARKQFTGFVCMAAGTFLGFASCVLSLINPIPELYNVILFGFTSVAILIIVAGMYLVFE